MRNFIACILILCTSIAYSQNTNLDSPEVKNSTIEFNGGKYNGYMIEFNAPPEIVEDAVIERFKLQGLKSKETKGFMVYRNVLMPAIDPVKPMDAFIKVERKSRKEKEQTTVYFIAAPPGEIGEEKLKSDATSISQNREAADNGDAFLRSLIPDVKQSVYDRDIINQQSQIKKEEKKLANLAEDLSEMEKKLKKLQSDIEYNKKAQERQTVDLEKAKNDLNEKISKNPKRR